MEGQQNIQTYAQQIQYTLLSAKFNKIVNFHFHKNLITDLNKEQQQFILPPFSALLQAKSYSSTTNYASLANLEESAAKNRNCSKTHPLRDFKNKQTLTQKTERVCRKQKKSCGKKKKEPQLTYKFIKLVKTNGNSHSIFEQRISSVNDINGKGIIILSDGRIIEGEFASGRPISHLRIQFNYGIVYKGPVYDYHPHGIGEMIFANKERFVGEFCYGEPHGEGKHYLPNGEIKREGEWKRGFLLT